MGVLDRLEELVELARLDELVGFDWVGVESAESMFDSAKILALDAKLAMIAATNNRLMPRIADFFI